MLRAWKHGQMVQIARPNPGVRSRAKALVVSQGLTLKLGVNLKLGRDRVRKPPVNRTKQGVFGLGWPPAGCYSVETFMRQPSVSFCALIAVAGFLQHPQAARQQATAAALRSLHAAATSRTTLSRRPQSSVSTAPAVTTPK